MYINLDVVMRLVQIGLVIAGIGALVTLAMLFKNLIQTLKALTGALDLLQRDLAKLEGPLDTVDELSNTVSEIQHSAKRAANTAIDTFQASSAHLMKWVDSKTDLSKKSSKPAESTESPVDSTSSSTEKPDFKKIQGIEEKNEQPEDSAKPEIKEDELSEKSEENKVTDQSDEKKGD